jgi:SnoaL-like domain
MTFAFVAPADELQIRNLIARYAYAIDGGEKETFASLFLEDGAWSRENPPPATQDGSALPQAVRGRTGLMDLIETAIIGRFQRKARHQMTDVLVEPGTDENSAKVLYRALGHRLARGPGPRVHVRQLRGGVRPHRRRLEVRDRQRPGPA